MSVINTYPMVVVNCKIWRSHYSDMFHQIGSYSSKTHDMFFHTDHFPPHQAAGSILPVT